jgi:hypothetical protein
MAAQTGHSKFLVGVVALGAPGWIYFSTSKLYWVSHTRSAGIPVKKAAEIPPIRKRFTET